MIKITITTFIRSIHYIDLIFQKIKLQKLRKSTVLNCLFAICSVLLISSCSNEESLKEDYSKFRAHVELSRKFIFSHITATGTDLFTRRPLIIDNDVSNHVKRIGIIDVYLKFSFTDLTPND